MASYAINPSYSNDYLINKSYYNPISYQGQQAQEPLFKGSVSTTGTPTESKKPGCTDGKDDGNIGFFSALGHALKGGVKFITGMFTDEKGDFSIGQTLKTIGTVALVAAATCIPVVGPFVVPALCAYGMADGGLKIAKGFVNAMDAETDAEAKAAWENVGSGATEGFLSYTGYKASGGFSAAREAASADLAAIRGPKAPAPTEPNVIDVDYVEVEPLQLEAPKTSTTDIVKYESKPATTDVVKYETNASTTDVVKYDPARAEARAKSAPKSEANAQSAPKSEASAKSAPKSEASAKSAPKSEASAQSAPNVSDTFVKNVSQKMSARRGGGVNSLTAQEKAKLAEILDISVDEVSAMSKGTYRKLALKYHTDHNGSKEIFEIVNALYKSAPKVESAVA